MTPDKERLMVHFRWITPLLVTILIFFVGQLATEIRNLRSEITETRQFAIQYTDKMVDLLLKTAEKKK